MSVFERAQEMGMLRAIGLDRRSVKRMVRLESLVISLFGGVLGIGLGVFFGWAAGELLSGDQRTRTVTVQCWMPLQETLPREAHSGRVEERVARPGATAS
ncbi:ABC-type antimicrobial peptide transport system permease subunit [Streptomyces sp. V3I7]|nr:ABC-type antimicrobial peptide transport system permease subunit [Streptomyces sp. V3I7]